MEAQPAIQVTQVVVFDWLVEVLVRDPPCKLPPHADYQIIKINRSVVTFLTSGAGSRLEASAFPEKCLAHRREERLQEGRAQTPIIRCDEQVCTYLYLHGNSVLCTIEYPHIARNIIRCPT